LAVLPTRQAKVPRQATVAEGRMTLLIEDQPFWSELNPDSLVQALACGVAAYRSKATHNRYCEIVMVKELMPFLDPSYPYLPFGVSIQQACRLPYYDVDAKSAEPSLA
jgi:hypothetical protein